MPLSHVTKVFAAKDCKVFPITADVPGEPAPTYGAGIDVPGIKTVTISGDVNSVELRGDNRLMDVSSTLGNITVSVEFAKMSLDLLAAWFSNTVADEGVTPAQRSVWELLGDSSIGYVGLTAQAVGADPIGGNVDFSLAKMMLTSFPEMGLAEEDYQTHTVEFMAIPALANDKWLSVGINETATALAAPA